MTPQKLYQQVLILRKQTDELIDEALDLAPSIGLCVFTGKLGAVLDVLCALEAAGAPIHDPDEAPHLLEKGEPLPVVRLGNTNPDTVPPEWCVAAREKDARGARDVIGLFHDEAAARWFAERWEASLRMPEKEGE